MVTKRGRRRQGNLYVTGCPTRVVLDHVTSRWGSLALVLLREGPHRFSELVRRIGGVSEKMMAQTLRALEGDGLLERTVFPTKPPSVEYALTPMGEELAEQLYGLTSWVEGNVWQVQRVWEQREAGAAGAVRPRGRQPSGGQAVG